MRRWFTSQAKANQSLQVKDIPFNHNLVVKVKEKSQSTVDKNEDELGEIYDNKMELSLGTSNPSYNNNDDQHHMGLAKTIYSEIP